MNEPTIDALHCMRLPCCSLARCPATASCARRSSPSSPRQGIRQQRRQLAEIFTQNCATARGIPARLGCGCRWPGRGARGRGCSPWLAPQRSPFLCHCRASGPRRPRRRPRTACSSSPASPPPPVTGGQNSVPCFEKCCWLGIGGGVAKRETVSLVPWAWP
jgi:hypothetical protein